MALEIESLRAERGSILSGSVLAEEIAPVDFQVEQVPPASESIPVDPSDDTQRLVEQLRCLARELQADADRLEATANHRSLKK
jgi:hypothetical protein